jgi:hypothetical protein
MVGRNGWPWSFGDEEDLPMSRATIEQALQADEYQQLKFTPRSPSAPREPESKSSFA